MKRTALTIAALVLAAAISANPCPAQPTQSDSPPFVLIPAKDIPPPVLTITSPPLGREDSWITTTPEIQIRGTVAHSSGIQSLLLNGKGIAMEVGGSFAAGIQLRAGQNRVTIQALSGRGSVVKRSIAVIYDSSAPTIELIEPRPTDERGFMTTDRPKTTVRVRAFDENGIRLVEVNGQPARSLPDSLYEREIPLSEGANDILVRASDHSGRQAERRFVVSHWGSRAGKDFLHSRCFALIIGIDRYRGKWPPLVNAVRDARAVEEVLRNRFVFERISTLYDEEATREGIINAMMTHVSLLQPEDRLFIYYSGHGDFNRQLNRGYWVPVDAADQSITKYIPNTDIQTYIGGMPAQHVLLVADACFAGDVFKGKTESVPFENTPSYFQKVAGLKSRKAMTSGGVELVVDGGGRGHSIFAQYFLQALNQIDGRYFDGLQIFEHLRLPVGNNAAQKPEYRPLSVGDAGGEFVFMRK